LQSKTLPQAGFARRGSEIPKGLPPRLRGGKDWAMPSDAVAALWQAELEKL